MPRIDKIMEFEGAFEYLKTRGLEKQFKKAKEKLLSGDAKSVDLKLRWPKEDQIYQFRISQKYRAYGKFYGSTLRVVRIDDHQ